MIGFTLEEAFEKVMMPLYPQITLEACYEQEHRIYHNLDHIKEMLKYVPHEHPEVEIIIDAILFHDIVHTSEPTAKGFNETLSVAEYLSYNMKSMPLDTPFGLEKTGSLEYEKKVIGAITATAHHLEDQKYLTDVAKWVLDLDLSTFALPWEEYCIWKERVESENALIWSDVKPVISTTALGRCVFLESLLKRQHLYYIKHEWEAQARKNITQDLRLSERFL
jgi:predicted metal-dependent HD superfamily phosphohydrolase